MYLLLASIAVLVQSSTVSQDTVNFHNLNRLANIHGLILNLGSLINGQENTPLFSALLTRKPGDPTASSLVPFHSTDEIKRESLYVLIGLFMRAYPTKVAKRLSEKPASSLSIPFKYAILDLPLKYCCSGLAWPALRKIIKESEKLAILGDETSAKTHHSRRVYFSEIVVTDSERLQELKKKEFQISIGTITLCGFIDLVDCTDSYQYNPGCPTELDIENIQKVRKYFKISSIDANFPLSHLMQLKTNSRVFPEIVIDSYTLLETNYKEVAFIGNSFTSLVITRESSGWYNEASRFSKVEMLFMNAENKINLSKIVISQLNKIQVRSQCTLSGYESLKTLKATLNDLKFYRVSKFEITSIPSNLKFKRISFQGCQKINLLHSIRVEHLAMDMCTVSDFSKFTVTKIVDVRRTRSTNKALIDGKEVLIMYLDFTLLRNFKFSSQVEHLDIFQIPERLTSNRFRWSNSSAMLHLPDSIKSITFINRSLSRQAVAQIVTRFDVIKFQYPSDDMINWNFFRFEKKIDFLSKPARTTLTFRRVLENRKRKYVDYYIE
jgi:hypothetical protein